MRRHAICLVGLLVGAGSGLTSLSCSGGGPHPPQVPDSDRDASVAPAPDATTGPAATLSSDECAGMLDHMLALYLDKQRGDRAVELVPTADDVAATHASMVNQGFLTQCVTFLRQVYDCTMAATALADAYRCAGVEPTPP